MKNRLILFLFLLFTIFEVNAKGEATLKNIKVNDIECKCIDYNCSIETTSSKAIITYELTDKEATVDRLSGFQVDLASLTTTIRINVSNTLNGEKVENTYVLTIEKNTGSSDNTIKSLSVNNAKIEVSKDIYVYPYLAKYDEKKITVKAEVNDPKAKIITKEMQFDFDLDNTSHAFDFVVEAENGETLTYRVFLTREEKPDTSLKNIKLNHGSLIFDKKKYEYDVVVEYNVNKLEIEAVPNHKDAIVKIEDKDLIVGDNKIKITVTNKKATSTYTLNVKREENIDKSIANLKTLEIKEYNKLDFEPNVLEYSLYFRDIPSFLNIKAIPLDSDAKVEILNNKELSVDDKVIIKVFLESKNITREYTLNILKKELNGSNKKAVLVALIILTITMIILFILEHTSKNKKKKEMIKKIKEMNKKKEKMKKEEKKESKKEIKKVSKAKKEEEEEIEII